MTRAKSGSQGLRKAARIIGSAMLLGATATGVAAGLGIRAVIRRRTRRFDLAGRVVVITGGSRGLGFVLAEECARQGATVAICARDERELERATVQIERKYSTNVSSGRLAM